jgi:hypothetical protein
MIMMDELEDQDDWATDVDNLADGDKSSKCIKLEAKGKEYNAHCNPLNVIGVVTEVNQK